MNKEHFQVYTNIDDVAASESKMISNTLEEGVNTAYSNISKGARDLYNEMTDINTEVLKKTVDKKPVYIKITWQTYRILAYLTIFLSFFVARYFYVKFEEMGSDKYVLTVYGIVSFFAIINLSVYLFMFVYYRYRLSVKGKKGVRGKRGKKGNSGKSNYCNISNLKVGTFKPLRKDKLIEEVIQNDIEDNTTKNTIIVRKWRYVPLYYSKPTESVTNPIFNNPLIISNKHLGFEAPTTKSTKITKPTKPTPIIGVIVNFHPKTGAIQMLEFLKDTNKKHKKFEYNPERCGTPFGRNYYDSGLIKKSKKQNFTCPPNSAVYKIDCLYDTDCIKGIRFFCQDVVTGKSVKVVGPDSIETYGVYFGKKPDPSIKDFYYNSIESKHLVSSEDKFYPTFLSINGSGCYTNANNDITDIFFEKSCYFG